MKHKESFNATLAIGFILILAAWVTFRMLELPEIFKFANTIHIIVILGCFGIISWNIIKLDYRNKYMDRMTGINNDAWIVRQGAILYYRNKLNGYDVIFLNVKDCKYINQKVTNQNGDIVLAEYANRLKAFLKKKGYIGRMGGDNFLVYIKDEYLDEMLKFINGQIISVTFEGRQETLIVSCRAGVCKIHDMDPKKDGSFGYRNVINRASIALSEAKEGFLDMYVYEDVMLDSLMKDTETLQRARMGLLNDEFFPYYQPKVDAISGRLCGAEGLVRWNKDGEIVMPGAFIPLLEHSGEITDLDYKLFEKVCADIKKWKDAGMDPVKVSTNFSKIHLSESDFAERIIDIKNRYGIEGKYVEVELTESTEGKDLVALREFSKKMKKENISIAIDDFGTGYSSLSLVKNFDADVIKLDKSFIDSATKEDTLSRNFVKDIICMIENLGEKTLCEGVEDKEQLDFLVDAGCNIIQGYYFDKPLPKEEFEKRLKSPIYKV